MLQTIQMEKTCENPSEPNSSLIRIRQQCSTTETMVEGEDMFSMDLENFPMSLIEVMLFKLEDNGEIAAQKLFKLLSETHSIKTNAFKISGL